MLTSGCKISDLHISAKTLHDIAREFLDENGNVELRNKMLDCADYLIKRADLMLRIENDQAAARKI